MKRSDPAPPVALDRPAVDAPRRPVWPLLAVALVAASLLFCNLGARYLWQDEAACAVLAERLVEYGRPVSFDGTNLITMDEFSPTEAPTLPLRTGSADVAVDYFVAKGDFKRDTTWIGQPWGQFVVAALGLELFGHGTWQARSFFAIAGVLTVLALFLFVRRTFNDPWMAALAAALLLGNVYWFLHTRQARYYSTATLFLLATFMAYLRWQSGRRWGGLVFVATAWVWFHQDFGSVWAVLAVLGVDALLSRERRERRPVLVFGSLALCMLPFVFSYQLFSRIKVSQMPLDQKMGELLFSVNHYQLPLVVLPILVLLCLRRRFATQERRVVVLTASLVLAQLVWMPIVAPAPFYRYVVDATPLSCLLIACAIVRGTQGLGALGARPAHVRLMAASFAGLILVSPLASLPIALLIPDRYMEAEPVGLGFKPELQAYLSELRGDAPDPNRAVVEFLLPRLEPGDEILCNYEDIPLMFYTDQPIRGGMPAFRVLDDAGSPPRFAILRSTVGFVHTDAFKQALAPYEWTGTPVDGPDIPWGNNPDPAGHYTRFTGQPLMVYEREGSGADDKL